ncbi:MAG: hypothetical protein H6633_13220 [Anaerolineales bacterium]|nr:hypothetical protein [Anaerolineales bacterium]
MKPNEVFYYADEFNISWRPTLQGDVESQRPTGHDPDPRSAQKALRHRGVNYHTGQTVVLIR